MCPKHRDDRGDFAKSKAFFLINKDLEKRRLTMRDVATLQCVQSTEMTKVMAEANYDLSLQPFCMLCSRPTLALVPQG